MTLTALDLFAGAGGASQGLRDAGFDVLGAVENDAWASRTYELNHPGTRLWSDDIRRLPASRVRRELDLDPGQLTLLKACPPCQGFSSLAEGRSVVDEAQNDLVLHTIRFVRALSPAAILLENVPGLGRDRRSRQLTLSLRSLGYKTREYRVNAVDFGVPQRRKRLIILAVRGLRADLPVVLHEARESAAGEPVATVRAAFHQLAAVGRLADPLDRARNLTPTVAARIRAIPVNGTRFDLPEDLQLSCHIRLDRGVRSATGSYGRMRLDEPAPTMTTRCTTPACGSFVHPTMNRGITLREAATLQAFPPTYDFLGPYGSIERQIGNAVPVRMAAALARSISSVLPAAS